MATIAMSAIFLLFFSKLIYCDTFKCYHCASILPESTASDARYALRSILYSAYNLPPVNKYCGDAQDIQFKTITQIECSSNDQCIKIFVRQEGE